MTDSPSAQPKSSNAIVVALSVVLLIVLIGGGYLINKTNNDLTASNAQVASLTGQLEDAQKEITSLQPLAEKARTMPITFRIDRHALTDGYTLFTFNRARDSLRFKVVINGGKTFPNVVIDGGKFWQLRGLASGDTVVVSSAGFDDKTVNIQ
jgi:hypothetical protein